MRCATSRCVAARSGTYRADCAAAPGALATAETHFGHPSRSAGLSLAAHLVDEASLTVIFQRPCVDRYHSLAGHHLLDCQGYQCGVQAPEIGEILKHRPDHAIGQLVRLVARCDEYGLCADCRDIARVGRDTCHRGSQRRCNRNGSPGAYRSADQRRAPASPGNPSSPPGSGHWDAPLGI